MIDTTTAGIDRATSISDFLHEELPKMGLSSIADPDYHLDEIIVAPGETRMIPVRIRKLLLCGLALLVAGMGPGALVQIPRALNIGTEEEVRHADPQVIGSHATVLLRPARRSAAADFHRDRNAGRNLARIATERNLALHMPRSLRALQVRIEV